MIDSPITLVLLGMSAVSVIGYGLKRRAARKAGATLPAPTDVSAMSTNNLLATLNALQSQDEYEARRRVTVLIIEELERRRVR